MSAGLIERDALLTEMIEWMKVTGDPRLACRYRQRSGCCRCRFLDFMAEVCDAGYNESDWRLYLESRPR